MVFKNLFTFVLLSKVASAWEGLKTLLTHSRVCDSLAVCDVPVRYSGVVDGTRIMYEAFHEDSIPVKPQTRSVCQTGRLAQGPSVDCVVV